MIATKWTPGPWQHKNRPPGDAVKSGFSESLHEAKVPHEMVISMGTMWGLGVDVAAVPAYGKGSARANADLISAAPDLYAALAMAPDSHSVDAIAGKCSSPCYGCMRKAALAKARGET